MNYQIRGHRNFPNKLFIFQCKLNVRVSYIYLPLWLTSQPQARQLEFDKCWPRSRDWDQPHWEPGERDKLSKGNIIWKWGYHIITHKSSQILPSNKPWLWRNKSWLDWLLCELHRFCLGHCIANRKKNILCQDRTKAPYLWRIRQETFASLFNYWQCIARIWRRKKNVNKNTSQFFLYIFIFQVGKESSVFAALCKVNEEWTELFDEQYLNIWSILHPGL